MIKTKLHSPIIAKNSHISNAVVEKVNLNDEQLFSDFGSTTPILPETGRIWFNSETGTFKFANIGIGGNGNNYVDEFLSKTDYRLQSVVSKIDFKDSIKIFNSDGTEQVVIDSLTKDFTINNSNKFEVSSTNFKANISASFILTDGTKTKISANNTTDSFNLAYKTSTVNGQDLNLVLSKSIIVNDGITDKIIIDNTNNNISISYSTISTNSTNTNNTISEKLIINDGTNDKIVADNIADELTINYNTLNITGDTTFDGSVLINGNLTVGGQTTKVDISAENMRIADNVIILNSNLTTEDPRLASAIVEGTDVDNNAGIVVNRGNQGELDLITWVESTDVSTLDSLKLGTAQVSIWNYEIATPAYTLSQILDAYTLGRVNKDISGSNWIGYDGENGVNHQNGLTSGKSASELNDYTFKLNPDSLDNTVDSIVHAIDDIKYNTFNSVRVGETVTAGISFKITHNLNTVYVDVKIQREDNGRWFYDILPIEVIDSNTILIESTEITKIRYMISAIQGFDVNQATDLVIS